MATPSTDAAAASAAPVVTGPESSPVIQFDVVVEKVHSLMCSVKEYVSKAKQFEAHAANNAKEIISIIKDLDRTTKKVLKDKTGDKKGKKKSTKSNSDDEKGNGGNRNPFERPVLLSDDMCNFLGVDNGTELPRIEVTKRINAYIKQNGLQKPEDGRKILPDAKLKSLFAGDVSDDDVVTYFNLQTRLKHHMQKPVSATTSA